MLMKLFSLQMEKDMLDKFCKHFSIVFDYELYQENKIKQEHEHPGTYCQAWQYFKSALFA